MNADIMKTQILHIYKGWPQRSLKVTKGHFNVYLFNLHSYGQLFCHCFLSKSEGEMPLNKVYFLRDKGSLTCSCYYSKITSTFPKFVNIFDYEDILFHHTVIEICYEKLKSSEREKLKEYPSYKSPNWIVLKFFFVGPLI